MWYFDGIDGGVGDVERSIKAVLLLVVDVVVVEYDEVDDDDEDETDEVVVLEFDGDIDGSTVDAFCSGLLFDDDTDVDVVAVPVFVRIE